MSIEEYEFYLVMGMRETLIEGDSELERAKGLVKNNSECFELQQRFNGGWLIYDPETDTFN